MYYFAILHNREIATYDSPPCIKGKHFRIEDDEQKHWINLREKCSLDKWMRKIQSKKKPKPKIEAAMDRKLEQQPISFLKRLPKKPSKRRLHDFFNRPTRFVDNKDPELTHISKFKRYGKGYMFQFLCHFSCYNKPVWLSWEDLAPNASYMKRLRSDHRWLAEKEIHGSHTFNTPIDMRPTLY